MFTKKSTTLSIRKPSILIWVGRSQRKNVYYIDIERFINIENKYERKSVTEAIADLEATYYYDYFKK